MNEPSKEALLELKDRLKISDNEWPYVVQTFQLSSSSTIHHIRLLRKEKNSILPSYPTNGRGSQINLLELLKVLLTQRPPKDPQKRIQIKIAFDGANMTSSKKIKQEIGTLEILTEREISEIKSFTNAMQWIIYIGDETYEDLERELEQAIPVIKYLNETKKVN